MIFIFKDYKWNDVSTFTNLGVTAIAYNGLVVLDDQGRELTIKVRSSVVNKDTFTLEDGSYIATRFYGLDHFYKSSLFDPSSYGSQPITNMTWAENLEPESINMVYAKMPILCECGAHKVKDSRHSSYCPEARNQ